MLKLLWLYRGAAVHHDVPRPPEGSHRVHRFIPLRTEVRHGAPRALRLHASVWLPKGTEVHHGVSRDPEGSHRDHRRTSLRNEVCHGAPRVLSSSPSVWPTKGSDAHHSVPRGPRGSRHKATISVSTLRDHKRALLRTELRHVAPRALSSKPSVRYKGSEAHHSVPRCPGGNHTAMTSLRAVSLTWDSQPLKVRFRPLQLLVCPIPALATTPRAAPEQHTGAFDVGKW